MMYTSICPVCGSNPFTTINKKIYPDNYDGLQRKVAFEYFKLNKQIVPKESIAFCTGCRAIYRAHFFDQREIEQIYSSLYRLLEDSIYSDTRFAYNNQAFLDGCSQKMYNIVKEIENRFQTQIRDIFDIGGRDGFRLKDLANEGYKCKVFDPIDCEVCNPLISKEPLWSEQIGKDEKADFIFLCNVLEHCIDPHSIIMDCHEHLREGGFLYVELPSDIETVLDWMLFGIWRKKNLSVDNTHYVFYSRKAISLLLESFKFKGVRIEYSILPVINTNVLEVIGRKESAGTKTSPYLSLDFDLLSSGYFLRLLPRIVKKVKMSLSAYFNHDRQLR